MTLLKYKCDGRNDENAIELKADPAIYIDPDNAYKFVEDNLTRNIIDETKIDINAVRTANE